LLTSTSTKPYCVRAASISFSHSAGSAMFAATAWASPPAARISATVVSSAPANG